MLANDASMRRVALAGAFVAVMALALPGLGAPSSQTQCAKAWNFALINHRCVPIWTDLPTVLIGSSSSAGAFPSASVSGEVAYLNDLNVAVRSYPDLLHITVQWSLTCTQRGRVSGNSGSFEDDTPFGFLGDQPITVPFGGWVPETCLVTVLASGDGTTFQGDRVGRSRIWLRVYGDINR
jgi:hypothetical protein